MKIPARLRRRDRVPSSPRPRVATWPECSHRRIPRMDHRHHRGCHSIVFAKSEQSCPGRRPSHPLSSRDPCRFQVCSRPYFSTSSLFDKLGRFRNRLSFQNVSAQMLPFQQPQEFRLIQIQRQQPLTILCLDLRSAHSMRSPVTGVSASALVPAPIASTPSYFENIASAVGLRSRFSLQTKRILAISANYITGNEMTILSYINPRKSTAFPEKPL